jgi:cytochrome c oxidase subunit 4
MTSIKFYGAIYVVLFAFATIQAAVEMYTDLLDSAYWLAFAVIIVLSLIKAVYVAGYYQHLRWEPKSLTYLLLTGLLAAVTLTMAASYSIM